MNNPTKTKVNVLVTVEVEHEANAPITFINDLSLSVVSMTRIVGANNIEGPYKSTALTKEVIELDALKTKDVNKHTSASLKASDEYRYIVKNKNEDNYRLFRDKPHVHNSYSWELFGAEDDYEKKGTPITKEQAIVFLKLKDEKHLPSWENAVMGVFPVWNYSDH